MSRRISLAICLFAFVVFTCCFSTQTHAAQINDEQTQELITILDQIFDKGADSLSDEQLKRLDDLLQLIDPDIAGPTIRTLRQQILEVLGNPVGVPNNLLIPVKDDFVPINQGFQMPMMPPMMMDCEYYGECCPQ